MSKPSSAHARLIQVFLLCFSLSAYADDRATKHEDYTFCQKPSLPLSPAVRMMCPLSAEVPDCAALIDACEAARKEDEKKAEKDRLSATPEWMRTLVKWLAELSLNDWFLNGLRALSAALLAWVLWWAVKRFVLLAPWSSEEGDDANEPTVARDAIKPSTPADALWQAAEGARRAGSHEEATRLYLHAAIEHGAEAGKIRKTEANTYGECARQIPRAERAPLTDLVREVERHDFGGETLGPESASHARTLTVTFLRSLGLALNIAFLLVLGGCGQADELKKYVGGDKRAAEIQSIWSTLSEHHIPIQELPTPLYDLKLSETVHIDSAIWVDTSETELDDDARHNLGEWVKAGGLLVLVDSDLTPRLFLGQERTLQSLRLHADLLADATRSTEADERLSARAVGCTQAAAMFADKEQSAIDGIFANDTALMNCGAETDAPSAHGLGLVRRIPGASAFSNLAMLRPQNEAFALRYFDELLALPGQRAAVEALEMAPEPDAAKADNRVPYPDGPPSEHIAPSEDKTQVKVAAARSLRTLYITGPASGTRPATSPVHALYLAGLGSFFWHGVVGTLLLLWSGASRLGRARRVLTSNRERYATHVETLGMHYADNMSLKHKRELVAQWLRTRKKTRKTP